MYRVVPSPLGGMMLTNEEGRVIMSGSNIHDLRRRVLYAMEGREISPFLPMTDEFGEKTTVKEFVRQ